MMFPLCAAANISSKIKALSRRSLFFFFYFLIYFTFCVLVVQCYEKQPCFDLFDPHSLSDPLPSIIMHWASLSLSQSTSIGTHTHTQIYCANYYNVQDTWIGWIRGQDRITVHILIWLLPPFDSLPNMRKNNVGTHTMSIFHFIRLRLSTLTLFSPPLSLSLSIR